MLKNGIQSLVVERFLYRGTVVTQCRLNQHAINGDLWRRAVDPEYSGATTRRPSPATRT